MSYDSLLRLSQVLSLVGISRATWYRGVAAGIYPKPVRIGLRAVGWRVSEISVLVQTGIIA